MRKIKIEKTIKKFDELSEYEQEQVINNYRDINVDLDDWNDYILFNTRDKIKKETMFNFEESEFIWSVGNRNSKFGVYSKEVIRQILHEYGDKGLYDIDLPNKIGSFLNHLGGGICRQGTTEHGLAKVYFEDDTDESQNKAITEYINEQIDKLIDILKEQHTANEEAYNHAISDESIKDTLISNDYEFDTDTMWIY